MQFQSLCPNCKAQCDTNMKVVGILVELGVVWELHVNMLLSLRYIHIVLWYQDRKYNICLSGQVRVFNMHIQTKLL